MTDRAADWDPRKTDDPVKTLAELATAMYHGRAAFEQRSGELAAGYPGGRGGNGDSDGPDRWLQPNQVAERWERHMRQALEDAYRAWKVYEQVSTPRVGATKLADPGCDLCAQVEGHFCEVFGVRVIMTEPKTKRARPEIRILRLCEWCFTRVYPSRMGRLPRPDEVAAHARGLKVRWHGGVEPQLVEVICPDCGDESRTARRACTTCLHSGKVLKQRVSA